MSKRVRLIFGVAALTLCGAGCAKRGTDTAPVTPQVLVSAGNVVRAEARRLEGGTTFTGELVPAEVVEVMARFDGDLETVLVREGQAVRRGQPLARYRPRDVKDAWESAEAGLKAAQSDLEAAQNAERRQERLLAAGAAAPSELELAQSQRKAAEARLRTMQAQHNLAQENALEAEVPSPISGAVSAAIVHSGDRTAVGDKMFTLVDTRVMELSATVPSEALSRVQKGTAIEFHLDAFPGEKFTGVVDRVNPTTEPGTRQVRVYARVENRDRRLVGGLFASGRVLSAVRERATAAPAATLRQEGGEPVVYRVRGGVAERIAVRTGLIDEAAGFVELLGGIAPGDSLLMGVVPGLRPGALVRVLAAKAAPAGAATPDAAAAPAAAGK